jgi:hypothetical protein
MLRDMRDMLAASRAGLAERQRQARVQGPPLRDTAYADLPWDQREEVRVLGRLAEETVRVGSSWDAAMAVFGGADAGGDAPPGSPVARLPG